MSLLILSSFQWLTMSARDWSGIGRPSHPVLVMFTSFLMLKESIFIVSPVDTRRCWSRVNWWVDFFISFCRDWLAFLRRLKWVVDAFPGLLCLWIAGLGSKARLAGIIFDRWEDLVNMCDYKQNGHEVWPYSVWYLRSGILSFTWPLSLLFLRWYLKADYTHEDDIVYWHRAKATYKVFAVYQISFAVICLCLRVQIDWSGRPLHHLNLHHWLLPLLCFVLHYLTFSREGTLDLKYNVDFIIFL